MQNGHHALDTQLLPDVVRPCYHWKAHVVLHLTLSLLHDSSGAEQLLAFSSGSSRSARVFQTPSVITSA